MHADWLDMYGSSARGGGLTAASGSFGRIGFSNGRVHSFAGQSNGDFEASGISASYAGTGSIGLVNPALDAAWRRNGRMGFSGPHFGGINLFGLHLPLGM